MKILETERLVLRWLGADDAAFIHQLVNEPAWLRYIGDRGVRTLDDARVYIEKRFVEMYGRLGFGLYLVELKHSGEPVGICGLIKRESLEDVDLGFALLSKFWARGVCRGVGVGRDVLRDQESRNSTNRRRHVTG